MIYGKVTIGSDTRTVNGIHRVVNRVQETSGGVIHSLSLYGERSGGGGAKTRVWAVIYADNAGVPGALLAVSSDFYDYGTSPEWHTFTGLSYHSTINNYYWIGYIAADKFIHYYDGGAADQLARAADGDTTPDDPFGPPTLSPDEMSCYITNIGGTQAVDTDGTGDYTTLNSWESTENGDLVTATVTSTVNCEASSGTADTTDVTLAGWTTSADYDMTIRQADSDRHSGIWNTNIYRKTGEFPIVTYADWVTIDGLQLHCDSSSNSRTALQFGANTGGHVVKNNILRGSDNARWGVRSPSVTADGLTVYNNLAYGFLGDSSNGAGISTYTGLTQVIIVDNNTVYGSYKGFEGGTNDGIYTNNLARNTTLGFAGNWSAGGSDFNSSDDDTATAINATKTSGSPWNNSGDADADYFLDAGADDFRPGTGDLHINVGDDLSGTFTDDCVGTNRGSGANTWDLGYFEFVPVGDGAPVQGLFMLISKTWMLAFPIAGVVKNNKMTRRELSNPMKWIE